MPKSVPPEPWKLSRRVPPAPVATGAAGVGAMTAVAVATEPFAPGRAGDAATGAPDAAAGADDAAAGAGDGAAARGALDGAGGGVGGRRIFSSAAADTEATTPHCAHLSRSTAGAPQRGHAVAITSPAAAPASRHAPIARAARRG